MIRDPPHLLKPLQSTTIPKRLLWLDCASTTTKETGAYVQRWRAGALGTTHWTSRNKARKDTIGTYDNATELWQAADSFCTPRRRVVLFAHDLALQLRISRALVELPRLGWTLERIVLERTSAWALLRDGDRSLVCCDLQSWSPVSLNKLAADVTYGKVTNVEVQAGPLFHVNACKSRAQCVRDCVLQVLSWIEGENLGPFRPTGSGQSYAAYRRKFLTHKPLVHDDELRLVAERAAMWTGRCEAWQHGRLTQGPYVELDMTAAYCTIARDCDVPTVAGTKIHNPSVSHVVREMMTYSVLAHVQVTTDVPCVPARMGGRTVWPVGTFDTWLWDPELELAMKYAKQVVITSAFRYVRTPALRHFATWTLNSMNDQTQVYGLVPKRVAKHWSRCLVGRLGLRYRSWQKFATTDESDLRLVTYIDIDDGTSSDMLIAGHDWLLLSDMQESLESLPQIPSWVMSECRRRLWNAMERVGLDNVVYVDTDSIIIRDTQHTRLCIGTDTFDPGLWAVKGRYSELTVTGPRNLTCNNDRRIAGVPTTARQVAPLEFSGQVMRSIKESMRNGELDCVASIPRTFHMAAKDLRREHLPNHRTAPFTVTPAVGEDQL